MSEAAPKLPADEIEILQWAEPEGSCAIVWPTGALDTWYIAGRALEARGLLANIQHSPEIWVITDAGREALAQERGTP